MWIVYPLTNAYQPNFGYMAFWRQLGGPIAGRENVREFQGSLAMPSFGYKQIQDFTFVINLLPKVILFAIDPHENLVEMPAPG